MSRRSTLQRSPFSTLIGVGLSVILALGLLIGLPVATAAQDSSDELPRILGRNWQLLEYRDQNGGLEPVPPGIAVRFYLWAGTFDGKGACGSFLSDYTLQKETLIVDEPSVAGRACDPAAQAIDDEFLRNVTDTAVWSVDGSVLELRDPVGDVVMTLTEALIPSDPTIAPWQLARIAASDGSIGPVIPGTDPSIQFLRG
ncbi:MAG: META domain-containing protein, partial [Chloroflexota bacterium]